MAGLAGSAAHPAVREGSNNAAAHQRGAIIVRRCNRRLTENGTPSGAGGSGDVPGLCDPAADVVGRRNRAQDPNASRCASGVNRKHCSLDRASPLRRPGQSASAAPQGPALLGPVNRLAAPAIETVRPRPHAGLVATGKAPSHRARFGRQGRPKAPEIIANCSSDFAEQRAAPLSAMYLQSSR